MKNNHIPDPLITAYIAARRTERTLDRTAALARQWRDRVSTASQDGDDLLAAEALQNAQYYHTTIADLRELLADQEYKVARLQFVGADAD